MSAFSRVAEKKIREAIEQGEFDRLPGRGEPIDLEGYFKLPVELRLSYSILRSAGCVPTEVELLRAIDRTRSELRQATDPAKRQALQKQLNEEELRLRLALENRQNG
jgi:hypothetical protein